jgi:hypothetical protein
MNSSAGTNLKSTIYSILKSELLSISLFGGKNIIKKKRHKFLVTWPKNTVCGGKKSHGSKKLKKS